jgi:hypothetical protein
MLHGTRTEGGTVRSADDGRCLACAVLLVTLPGWLNRQQQEVIEYLLEENRVLREQLRGRRVRLTDDHRFVGLPSYGPATSFATNPS